MKVLMTAIFIVFSVNVTFATTKSKPKPAPPAKVPAPPVVLPEPRKFGISYEQARSYWEKGTTLPEQTLLGDWKWISASPHKYCTTLTQPMYNPQGIKNNDDTLVLLRFFVDYEGLPGFPPQSSLKVLLLNLGSDSANQGSYRTQEGLPQFSQWGYRDGVIAKDTWFEFSCRKMVGTTEDLMICGIEAKSTRPLSWISCNPGQQKYGFYNIYRKM